MRFPHLRTDNRDVTFSAAPPPTVFCGVPFLPAAEPSGLWIVNLGLLLLGVNFCSEIPDQVLSLLSA